MENPSQKSSQNAPIPGEILGPVGRFPIFDIWPTVSEGRPAKATVDEPITIRATATREGHDALGVNVVLISPSGNTEWVRSDLTINDIYACQVSLTEMGLWNFRIEAWDDVWATWHHAAGLKVPAGVDVEIELEEGARILERALAQTLSNTTTENKKLISAAIDSLRNKKLDSANRLVDAFNPVILELMHSHPIRDLVSTSKEFSILVERERALYGAWYEFSPRSEGATLNPYKS